MDGPDKLEQTNHLGDHLSQWMLHTGRD
jgi:hypothetical protein